MGDGGAYFLGGAISIGLIKIYQENLLSPWYVMLMLIYPVTDACASLIRRLYQKNQHLN